MIDTSPHYFLPAWLSSMNRTLKADLCVYGGTAAGITAAMASAQGWVAALYF